MQNPAIKQNEHNSHVYNRKVLHRQTITDESIKAILWFIDLVHGPLINNYFSIVSIESYKTEVVDDRPDIPYTIIDLCSVSSGPRTCSYHFSDNADTLVLPNLWRV